MTGITNKFSAGVVVMMALMANAYAGNACPTVGAIQQTAMKDGGFVYTAAASKGLQWTGENPIAAKEDLIAVAFEEAIEDVLRVRVLVEDRRQGRDPRPMLRGRSGVYRREG